MQHGSYTTARLKQTLRICKAGHSKELTAFCSSDQTIKESTVFLGAFPKQAIPSRLSLQNLDIQYKITHSFRVITLLFLSKTLEEQRQSDVKVSSRPVESVLVSFVAFFLH